MWSMQRERGNWNINYVITVSNFQTWPWHIVLDPWTWFWTWEPKINKPHWCESRAIKLNFLRDKNTAFPWLAGAVSCGLEIRTLAVSHHGDKSQPTSIREKEAFESMRQTLRRATRRRPESCLSRSKSKKTDSRSREGLLSRSKSKGASGSGQRERRWERRKS
jgi:hypothetical protein